MGRRDLLLFYAGAGLTVLVSIWRTGPMTVIVGFFAIFVCFGLVAWHVCSQYPKFRIPVLVALAAVLSALGYRDYSTLPTTPHFYVQNPGLTISGNSVVGTLDLLNNTDQAVKVKTCGVWDVKPEAYDRQKEVDAISSTKPLICNNFITFDPQAPNARPFRTEAVTASLKSGDFTLYMQRQAVFYFMGMIDVWQGDTIRHIPFCYYSVYGNSLILCEPNIK